MAGVTQKALKYYEKIGILSPAYIDPDSLYRYYSHKQLYFVGLITVFNELDIPLKEITTYIINGENIDYTPFLTRGATLAKEKIKRLQNNLTLINQLQDSLARAEMTDNYEQKLPEKHVYTSPYNPNLSQDEINQHFMDFFQHVQNQNLTADGWFGEMGFLHLYTGENLDAYFFIEIPPTKHLQLDEQHIKKISAGTWTSQINDDYEINNAHKIFADLFEENASNIIIETDIFVNKSIYAEPKKELRILSKEGDYDE